jgi:hypothetical protein
MKTPMITTTAFALLALLLQAAQAQPPGVQRTELVKNDVSGSSKEAIQVRVDFGPAAFAVNHRHPGEEIAFVLEGTLESRTGNPQGGTVPLHSIGDAAFGKERRRWEGFGARDLHRRQGGRAR